MIINNQILTATFNFELLNSNFSFWKYERVNKDDSLIILRELELSRINVNAFVACNTAHAAAATARWVAAVAASTARAADACAEDYTNYLKLYNQAREEFLETERIKGFEVLNLRTFIKMWISHHDIKVINS